MSPPLLRSFCSRFLSLFLLFFYMGCFLFTTKPLKPKMSAPPSPSLSPPSKRRRRSLFSILNACSYLKPIFFSKQPSQTNAEPESNDVPPSDSITPSPPTRKRSSASFTESDFASANKSHSRKPSLSRSNIFACSACGEVFHSAQLLDLHRSIRHAISEICDGDSAKNVVTIIFRSSWKLTESPARSPRIHRILKIHNSPNIVARFEEYREAIKAKATRARGKRDERCMADGNELLRFHCSTFLCSLGVEEREEGHGSSNNGLCEQELCSVCGIIRDGFSAKLDGILMMASSSRAHEAIPEEMEEEFRFMNVKRAMLVCRVVAGQVAREGEGEEGGRAEDKANGGFDSVVVVREGAEQKGDGGPELEEEEVLVFSPRAVLPCFVITYSI